MSTFTAHTPCSLEEDARPYYKQCGTNAPVQLVSSLPWFEVSCIKVTVQILFPRAIFHASPLLLTLNWPFYSCVLCCQAFAQEWRQGWPWCDCIIARSLPASLQFKEQAKYTTVKWTIEILTRSLWAGLCHRPILPTCSQFHQWPTPFAHPYLWMKVSIIFQPITGVEPTIHVAHGQFG